RGWRNPPARPRRRTRRRPKPAAAHPPGAETTRRPWTRPSRHETWGQIIRRGPAVQSDAMGTSSTSGGTRAALLTAARSRFATVGFDACRLADLCADASLTTGAL